MLSVLEQAWLNANEILGRKEHFQLKTDCKQFIDMESKCVKCGKKAVISPAYGPHSFCKQHFLEFFEKRVRKTIRENRLVEGREKLVVAYSGGKDSAVTLYLVNKIFGKSNKVEALLIDEGIPKYRDKALAIAEANCRKWNVPFRRVSFEEEFGFTMVDVMGKTGPKKEIGSTCAYCGVLRRQLMNKHAREMGAGKLGTGHNLDDEAQSVLMNVFDADVARFLRLGPKSPSLKGMVPRIKPLYLSPEKEVIAFAKMQGIKYFEQQCCPFKWQAKRNEFRQLVEEFEAKFPDTMFSVVGFLKQVKGLVGERVQEKKLNSCKRCGEATSGRVCKACKMVKGIKG
jgi:uncharacterized protein (TIGR00269 family)